MKIRRQSANGAVRSGSSRPEPYAEVTTVDQAFPGEKYRALRRSHAFTLLSELNVPVPGELQDITSEDAFPTRIGTVEDRELSNLASFWGTQYSRAITILSLARAERKRLEAVKAIEEKKIFDTIRPQNPRSTFVDALWGEVYKRPRIRQLGRDLRDMETLETMMDGLTKGFQTYLQIVQGEMTWRMSERRAMRE
jgi:hypothetical protein